LITFVDQKHVSYVTKYMFIHQKWQKNRKTNSTKRTVYRRSCDLLNHAYVTMTTYK